MCIYDVISETQSQDTWCLKMTFSVLDVEAFERLLGPCMELMKRNIDDYEDQLVKIFGSKANVTDIR